MELSRNRNTARWLYALCFAASAFVGVLFFSETTSPLYSDWGFDSAMFQTIGKGWCEGIIPYVGLFDHKGPMIFFINAVGYAICGRTGVYILQSLFLMAAEYLAYKLLRTQLSKKVSLAAALLMPPVLAANLGEGNTTEEYIIPLLFASFYLMQRWCSAAAAGEYEHDARGAFVYGACFGFAVMTRITNALGVCVGVAVIVVALVVKGRWKNLGANALAFILGVALLVVPFCVYFAAHGALYDMWYGTILFNLDYSAASGTEMQQGLLTQLVLFRRNIAGWCLVFAALWGAMFKKRGARMTALFWLPIALINTLFMYTLNDYAHYGICLLPFAYIALCELFSADLAERRVKLSHAVGIMMVVVVLISCGAKVYKEKTLVYPPQALEEYGDDYIVLLDRIPENERDSFVAFDCPRRIYLKGDIMPAFRFFTLQQWMSTNSPAFAETIYREFDECNVKWVMTFNLYHTPLVTSDIISEKYTLVAQSEYGLYSLYRLNE